MPPFGRLDRALWLVTLSPLVLGSSAGCGALIYQVDVVNAESAVSEAEHAGAAEASPYEYYAAREYLTEAQHEAAEAAYEDAMHYAERANDLARQALSRVRSSSRDARGDRAESAGAAR